MVMETKLQTINKKIVTCIIINIVLLIILYCIPIKGNPMLENICLFKLITGKNCFNCGMTRAFLSVLHFNFEQAMEYNRNVVFIFPLTVIVYAYSWIKFILKKEG